MTRIVHLTSVHGRKDVRILIKECASLARAGYDTHLAVADGQGPERCEGVQIHDVGAAGGRAARMLGRPWALLRMARALDARVCHFHDPELIVAGLLLRAQGRRVVYDAHEDVPRQILNKPWIPAVLRRPVAWLFERLENFAVRRFDAVVAATPHIARRFSANNPHCVDINNYPILQELAPAGGQRPARPDGRTVCYIGGIGENRGAVQLVAALERLDARCILAGAFESPALEARLRAMPGWSKVDYRGFVDRQGVAAILAESDVGVVLLHPIPNYLDSLPIKMFEYMSAGLPVLASDFPLWRDIVEAGGAGLCADPRDTAHIAAAMQALLGDPARRQAMGRAGRRIVETERNWGTESAKLTALYRTLAS